MKKKILFPAALFLAGALIFSLAGCATYRNPYEAATDHGTEGAASWLADNEESKSSYRLMYEEAVKDGFEGNYVDFLKEIGGVTDQTSGINAALTSVVEVYATFERAPSIGQSGSFSSIGAGLIYSLEKEKGNAYILTNYHIVYSTSATGKETVPYISDEIVLYLFGGKTEKGGISATYVGGAMDYDLAVLKVEGSDVLKESDARAVTAADSDAVTVGEDVYAVGNPDTKGISAVSGILSVAAEYITVTVADGSKSVSLLEMRTDAPVNHGNSGGGLFNADGKLIGVVNARSEKSGVEHFGYAIPANLAFAVAQNIIDNSKANSSKGALRAVLGITTGIIDSKSYFDEQSSKAYIMETVAVKSVSPGSASYGKLKEGDVICAIKIGDGEEKYITRMHMLTTELFKVRRGDRVTLVISRGEKTLSEEISYSNNNYFSLFS